MGTSKNQDARELLAQALLAGMSVPEAARDLGLEETTAYYYARRMVDEGVVRKLGRGRYAAPQKEEDIPAAHNGAKIAHSVAPQVEIPAYMRGRKSVTVYVERSPDEIENVILLELKIAGQWFPLPTGSDLRVCVGNDIPRWSAYQTTYKGVQAFRVTHSNGRRPEYPHNPDVPVTVDTK